MNKRILGVVALLALVVGVLWTWRVRAGHSELQSSASTAPEARPDPPSTTLTPAETRSEIHRTSVEQPDVQAAPVAAGFALVKVLVRDKSTRKPMAGIDVSASYDTEAESHVVEPTTRSRGKPFETLHTDAEGRVEIEVPPDVQVRLYATGMKQDVGYASANVPPLKAGTVHEVVLEISTADDMPFWMKLVDETTRIPIEGARVVEGSGKQLKSDKDGLVFFAGRTWSTARLHIEAETYAASYLEPEPGHERPDIALVVELPKSSVLRVQVVDNARRPVSGAKVELTTEGYNLIHPRSARTMSLISLEDPRWKAITDATGTAILAALPPHISLRGGITSPMRWTSAEEIVLEPGRSRDVEWKLTKGCDIQGVVLDRSNVPVTDRKIWLRKAERSSIAYFQSYSGEPTRTATTDVQGRFRFDEVSPGSWWVGPSAPEFGKAPDANDVAAVATVVDVAEGQSETEVTLHVDRGLFIRGRVLDAKGEPVKGGFVHAYDPIAKLFTNVNLQSKDNAFVLGPLIAGRYSLRATGHQGDADSDPVEANSGDQDVVLRLKAGATLSGRVLGPDGVPVPAKIWATSRGSTTFGVHGVNCKKDGTFSISGLEAGMYDFAASSTEGAVGVLEAVGVSAGVAQTDLVIRLRPGGHVRARHEGPEHYCNIEVVFRGIVVDLDGVERSASKEFASPAGSVIVRATYYEAEQRVAERTVDVKPGETVDVVFEKGAH